MVVARAATARRTGVRFPPAPPLRAHTRRVSAQPSWSGRDAVAEVDDAVVESALVEEFEVGADACGEGRLAAAEDHGPDEQLAFVDQACCEGLGGQVCPADGEVAGGCGLQFLDRGGVEVA